MPKKPSMRLTHHSTPSRSFILLTIIVLCTVYAALVLSRINRLYQEDVVPTPVSEPTNVTPTETALEEIPALDSTDWVEYNDDVYPFTIFVPKGWRIRLNDQIENLYIVSISKISSDNLIKLFIGKTELEPPFGVEGKKFTTSQGYEVTNYNNEIYHVKVGELYYTFDGTAASESKDVLKEIVNSAELQQTLTTNQ